MEQQEQTEQQKKTGQKPIRILHLSDLHIGLELSEHVRHRLWENDQRMTKKEVFTNAKSLFAHKFSKRVNNTIGKDIDFIVFTGDFVINGSNGFEHKKAFDIVKTFCEGIEFENLNNVFIVPGNHDIDRTAANSPNPNWAEIMKHHYKYSDIFYKSYQERKYLKECYESEIENQRKLKQYFDDALDLSITPLQTQFITPYFSREKINIIEEFCTKKYTKKENITQEDYEKAKDDFLWKHYDRGFLPENQIDDINTNDILESFRVNIALMHHNPIPIARKSNNFGTKMDYFPDSNYLANGPEALNKLMEKHINIILCGHSHQNSIVKHTNEHGDCLIISSLSCGEHDYSLGFNYIEIIPEDFTLKVIIKSHALHSENSWQCKEDEVILKNDNYESPFKNFSEGVNKLFNTVIDPTSKRHTILHYYYDTQWNNYYKSILGGLLNENNLNFKGFFKLQEIQNRNKLSEDDLKSAIQETITQGYLSEKLVNYLKNNQFMTRFREVIEAKNNNNNKFLTDLKDKNNDKEKRDLNYFIENVRCAVDSAFSIDKCVYFNINYEGVKSKFDWLINSIIAAINEHNNYNYAWLPYNIKGLGGQSLIEIEKTDNTRGEGNPDTSQIIFGFSIDDEPNNKSVLYVSDRHYNMEAGAIISNVKSLVIKTIRPLSRYVMECFPFYKDGKLYLNNLEFVSKNLGITKNEWDEYAIRLRTVFTDSNKDIEIVEKSKREIKEDLEILKHWLWCFLHHKIYKKNNKCTLKNDFIPWDNSDFNIIQCKNEN